jgi:predicted GNAT family acetyltransferase
MNRTALDRPVWASLQHQPAWGLGDARARRFRPEINRFAATPDEAPEHAAALAALIEPGEDPVYLLQVPAIAVPPGLDVLKQAEGVQMIATRPVAAAPDDEVRLLGDADAAEMLALARLTEPGPFFARTHTMGRFVGLRIDGRLAAMAGERMRFPGHVEVSGVCTHPDFRGRGLARRLSAAVAAHIQRSGDEPFLHAWANNRAAIALYERLGFVVRTRVHVAVLRRPASAAEGVERRPA